jgi:hypothetical protein
MAKFAKSAGLVAAVATSLLIGTASAQPAKKAPPQCFRSSDWAGWKATRDGRSMYIDTGLHRVWKLDLAQACPELNDIDAKLITRTSASWTCQPMDINMRVLRPGGGISYCQVRTITRLTPEQSRALPRNLRP